MIVSVGQRQMTQRAFSPCELLESVERADFSKEHVEESRAVLELELELETGESEDDL